MSKIETAQRLARQESVSIKEQIQQLKQLQQTGPEVIENFAAAVEPLAQAMVVISENAQATIEKSAADSRERQEAMAQEMKEILAEFQAQKADLQGAQKEMNKAVKALQAWTWDLKNVGKPIRSRFLILCLVLGLVTGTAAWTASAIWLKDYYIKSKIVAAWPDNPETQEAVMRAFRTPEPTP